jgi:hypothetical protein
MRHGQGI